MNTETPLYNHDLVIIKSDGEFLKHEDGRVVIYNDALVATEDFLKLDKAKMYNSATLSAKYRKALRKNIRQYSNG